MSKSIFKITPSKQDSCTLSKNNDNPENNTESNTDWLPYILIGGSAMIIAGTWAYYKFKSKTWAELLLNKYDEDTL